MTTKQIMPAIIVSVVAWRIYLRVRRNIGRQPLRAGRLKFSVGLFSAATVVLAVMSLRHLPALGALLGALALSVPLALYALKLTRFEDTPQGRFYTPNTAIGLGISALFLGRILYRFFVFSGVDFEAPVTPPPFQSPLTYFLFGLSAGYFIAYQAGVLIRSQRPPA